MRHNRIVRLLFLISVLLLPLAPVHGQGLSFSVRYTKEAYDGKFSGRVIVFLSRRTAEPRLGPNWFQPEPMYSHHFQNIAPGDAMVLGNDAVRFPGKLSALPAGEYTIQAVIDRNLGGRQIGDSPGNLYSAPVKATISPAENKTIDLVCDRIATERTFKETETVKEVKIQSKRLSAFYRRPTYLRAAVALPEAWAREPERKFPVVYEVPGFGGRHYNLSGATTVQKTIRSGEPFLYVVLDPDCPTGHSVFADSANNGPYGAALTTELIPEIEKRYRGIGTTDSRYVTGHSSGGWSSLWLQVTYPEVFGGCWSTSPDPVDFRDFQQIDLYNPQSNMFTDSTGQPRPLARSGTTPILFYRPFSDMERPLRGGQLGSFEGVFSPRGPGGEPRRLWNRDTGAIDPTVAEAWKKYDIGLTLRTHWKTLEPKLRGKIHVYMGDIDTFYLDGAVRLLQRDMKQIGADAVIEIVPGDHGSMMTPALRERIDTEIAAQFHKRSAAP